MVYDENTPSNAHFYETLFIESGLADSIAHGCLLTILDNIETLDTKDTSVVNLVSMDNDWWLTLGMADALQGKNSDVSTAHDGPLIDQLYAISRTLLSQR